MNNLYENTRYYFHFLSNAINSGMQHRIRCTIRCECIRAHGKGVKTANEERKWSRKYREKNTVRK